MTIHRLDTEPTQGEIHLVPIRQPDALLERRVGRYRDRWKVVEQRPGHPGLTMPGAHTLGRFRSKRDAGEACRAAGFRPVGKHGTMWVPAGPRIGSE